MAAASIGTAWIQIKPSMQGIGKDIGDQLSNEVGSATKKSESLFNGLAKVGFGALVAASAAAGVLIAKNIGGAIGRIDTLVAFPRTLQALGISAEDAAKSMGSLDKNLRGLPTALSVGAQGVQGLVTSGVEIDTATRGFLAFNNAMLAASVETGAASATMTQFQQALSRGKIEGQEWNSITANMPTAMQALQNETGKTKGELQELFREDPQGLLDNLIRLNEEGGGGLESLEKQARNATGGIGTAMANVNNAVQRGIQGIVEAIGGGDLEEGQKKISEGIANIGKGLGDVLKQFGQFFEFIIRNWAVFGPIIAGLTAIIAAATVWVGITKLVTAAQLLLNVALAANPIGLIVLAIVGLIAALVALWNTNEGFRNFVTKAWEGIKSVFMGVFNWVKGNWPLLLAILTGPIGLAVLAIIRNFDSILSFVRSMPGRIIGFFSGVGQAIGNVVSGAVKGAVNGVLSLIERTINSFIGLINGAIDVINKVPGVSIGKVSNINIPRLATGGIVTSPTLAIIGEGRESEAVIPLSKLDSMLNANVKGNTTTQEVSIGTIVLGDQGAVREFFRQLNQDTLSVGMGMTPNQGMTS